MLRMPVFGRLLTEYFFTFQHIIFVECPSTRMSAWCCYLQHRTAGIEENSIKNFFRTLRTFGNNWSISVFSNSYFVVNFSLGFKKIDPSFITS